MINVTSDALGRWGCGAWSGNSWFQLQWPDKDVDILIVVKELIPIVLAGALLEATEGAMLM